MSELCFNWSDFYSVALGEHTRTMVAHYFQFLSFVNVYHLYLLTVGNDRGPVLEVIVSRTNFISSHTSRKVRVVGLSTALANARDLADWLGIGQVHHTLVSALG